MINDKKENKSKGESWKRSAKSIRLNEESGEKEVKSVSA